MERTFRIVEWIFRILKRTFHDAAPAMPAGIGESDWRGGGKRWSRGGETAVDFVARLPVPMPVSRPLIFLVW